MRYMMLVCVDPVAETCAPEEDNIDEWVGEMDRRKIRVLGKPLTGVDVRHGAGNRRSVGRRGGRDLRRRRQDQGVDESRLPEIERPR